MDHLILEIDEDLRREKMQRIWNRLGSYVIGLSILIVVGTAIYVGVKNYRSTQQEGWTSSLLEMREYIEESLLGEKAKKEEAIKIIDKLQQSNNSTFVTLSGLSSLKIGDIKNIGNKDNNTIYNDMHNLGIYTIKSQSDLNDSSFNEAGIYLPFAKEQKAISLIDKGFFEEAKQLLGEVENSATTSAAMKKRASLLLNYADSMIDNKIEVKK